MAIERAYETSWDVEGTKPDANMAARAAFDKCKNPNKVNEKDIELLRSYDLSDKDISQIVQIIAYFNYINRVADGLGLEPEEFIDKKGYKNK